MSGAREAGAVLDGTANDASASAMASSAGATAITGAMGAIGVAGAAAPADAAGATHAANAACTAGVAGSPARERTPIRPRRVAIIGTYTPSLRLFRGRLIEEMRRRGHEVTAFGPEDDPSVRAYLDGLGCELRTYPLARAGLNPLADRRALAHLRRELATAAPDVVLSYTHKAVVYGSLAARDLGVPAIYSMITGLGAAFIGSTWTARAVGVVARALLRRALAVNRRVLVFNDDIARAFAARGIVRDPERIVRVAGSGVDLESFAPAPPVTSPVRFLLVGRLLADKGIREYADAAQALAARHPAVRCQLLGPFDPNASGLRPAEVERWRATGAIDYLGATDDVRPFLRDASALVLPSYAEGIPRSALEAMAMARPVITTDAPGCRETVLDGVTGYLVPARDARALERAMERIATRPEDIVRMGAAGRRLAEERFDVRAVNRAVLEALELA